MRPLVRSAWDRKGGKVMQHLRYVPTLTHGLLDNLAGIVLVVSPWVFDFQTVRGASMYGPLGVGGALLLMNLFTRHEMGLVKWIPMRTHFHLDRLLGLFLLVSPWVFDFSARVYLPHILAGAFIALLPYFSVHRPFDESLFTEVVVNGREVEVIRHARSAGRSY